MRTKIRTTVLGLAAACGYAISQARRPARFLPGAISLGLISWGIGMYDVRAGVIAAGISVGLLVVDNNSR